MKIIHFIVLLFSSPLISLAQVTTTVALDENQIKTIFTQEVKNELSIHYPIFKVYEYSDKLGKHYLVLTENEYKKEEYELGEYKSLNNSIKAFSLLADSSKYKMEWVITDFLDKQNGEEKSIWFWSKFIELNDIDADGIVEPIIIYGTSADNGLHDGRVKILIYYKGVKNAIRHQNSELDFERNTKVDNFFYELPNKIQEHVIKKIGENSNIHFPYGWENAMKNKKLEFDENK